MDGSAPAEANVATCFTDQVTLTPSTDDDAVESLKLSSDEDAEDTATLDPLLGGGSFPDAAQSRAGATRGCRADPSP